MKNCLRLLLILPAFIAVCCASVHGQDIHFSQYDQSPFNLNPGLAGQFDGAWRFTGIQRSQWRSVTVPYRTTGFSVDGRYPGGTPLHGGLSFYHDQAGDSRLRRTSVNALMGASLPLDEPGSLVFSGAVAAGLTSMQIDYTDLSWDNQWTGLIQDPSRPSGENFARDGRTYINIHLGAALRKTWEGGRSITGGLGLFNLSSPRQSFFDQAFVRLDRRINLHATWVERVHEQWEIRPSMLFMSQGAYREWDIGGTAHYILSPAPFMFRAIYGGLFMRARDAGFLVAGVRYDEWNVGLSYDINTSALRTASAGRGGFELSAVYILPPRPSPGTLRKVCPDYL